MASLPFVSFLIAAVFVAGSFQQDGDGACDISYGLSHGIGNDTERISVPDNCSTGDISWHYPRGRLIITIPRTVIPNIKRPRKKIRVCFQGQIGEGVASIEQNVTLRKEYTFWSKFTDAKWFCMRPSRDPRGVLVTLAATDKTHYLKVIRYKVELAHRKGGKGKGGGRGNRRGKGRGKNRGKGRGNRPGKGTGRRKGDDRDNSERTRHGSTQ